MVAKNNVFIFSRACLNKHNLQNSRPYRCIRSLVDGGFLVSCVMVSERGSIRNLPVDRMCVACGKTEWEKNWNYRCGTTSVGPRNWGLSSLDCRAFLVDVEAKARIHAGIATADGAALGIITLPGLARVWAQSRI